jgi:hypothetical protein
VPAAAPVGRSVAVSREMFSRTLSNPASMIRQL